MTTIPMIDPSRARGRAREIFDAVLARERSVFGATSVSNIWRCMGHWPSLLATLNTLSEGMQIDSDIRPPE